VPDSRFCDRCGAPTAESTSPLPTYPSLEWEAKLNLARSTVVLKQLAFALGFPVVFLFCFVLILEWPVDRATLQMALKIALIVAGILAALVLVVLKLVYGSGYELGYTLTEQGIEGRPHGRTARTNVIVNFLLMFSGRPSAAGAGMLAQSRQVEYVAWDKVNGVDTDPNQRTITLLKGKKPLMVVACDEVHYEEVLRRSREAAARVLPDGVTLGLSGTAEAFQESFAEFGLAISLAVLVIYMLLAAQFESLVHPFTVMLALPLALVGALGALYGLSRLDLLGVIHAPGMTLNLFSLIGMILLMGLVTKNSILLVDYANQLRAEGLDKVEAMRRAAPVRMRPVLMTSVAMIFGVLPAAVGVGPGAETRQSMAVAVAAGMISSTALTLLVVPAFYLVLDDVIQWLAARARRALRRGPEKSVRGPGSPTSAIAGGATEP